MTSPPKEIQVKCPKCGTSYRSWHRPSINLQLDDFDDEYIESVTTATCPNCGLKVHLGALIVREDGTWEIPSHPD